MIGRAPGEFYAGAIIAEVDKLVGGERDGDISLPAGTAGLGEDIDTPFTAGAGAAVEGESDGAGGSRAAGRVGEDVVHDTPAAAEGLKEDTDGAIPKDCDIADLGHSEGPTVTAVGGILGDGDVSRIEIGEGCAAAAADGLDDQAVGESAIGADRSGVG